MYSKSSSVTLLSVKSPRICDAEHLLEGKLKEKGLDKDEKENVLRRRACEKE